MSPTPTSLTQQVLGSDRYEIYILQSLLTLAYAPAPQQIRRVLTTGAERDEWPFGYSVYQLLTGPSRPELVELPREILLTKLRKDSERLDLPYTDDQMVLTFINEYVSNHIGMRFFNEQWHELHKSQLPLAETESTSATERRGRNPMVVQTPEKRDIARRGRRLMTDERITRTEAARRLNVHSETLKKYMGMLEAEEIKAVKPP